MSTTDECISKVRALVEEHLQLLNLSLFICDKRSADFADEELKCGLSENVQAVVVPMSLAAGQSITTTLQFSERRGIPCAIAFPSRAQP